MGMDERMRVSEEDEQIASGDEMIQSRIRSHR